MNFRRYSLFSASLAVAIFLTSCSKEKGVAKNTEPSGGQRGLAAEGRPAPAWVLRDVEGREVKSSDLKGKVVVLDFWATWCAPCRAEIPGYIALYKKYKDKGLVIVGVSVDSKGPDVVKKFIQENGMTYPVVMADDSIAERFGGIDAIPTTFLIDRDGRIKHQKMGIMETTEYEALVKSAL